MAYLYYVESDRFLIACEHSNSCIWQGTTTDISNVNTSLVWELRSFLNVAFKQLLHRKLEFGVTLCQCSDQKLQKGTPEFPVQLIALLLVAHWLEC